MADATPVVIGNEDGIIQPAVASTPEISTPETSTPETSMPETSTPETNQQREQPSGNEPIEYFDFMIIGMTGQGKSTTADKILIANPDGIDYKNMPNTDIIENEEKHRMEREDISMWLISPDDEHELKRVETRLKNLVFYRRLENPHEEVKKSRAAGMNIYIRTSNCELVSNDQTKLRVLDVPGFFSEISSTDDSDTLYSPMFETACKTNKNHLTIMRSIIRIQAAMGMRFRRILYFLPVRGQLERVSTVLKQELQLLVYYFGRSIFECMVIVTTVSYPESILNKILNEDLFPEEMTSKTRETLEDAFTQVLGEEMPPKPPIMFISLIESCESILQKAKLVSVAKDYLQLRFEPNICVKCSIKRGAVKGENVIAIPNSDSSQTIPHDESTCHPIFIPKFSRLQKFKGGVAYIVKFKWARRHKWPDFSEEVCAKCNEPSGSPGCMQIGGKYQLPNGQGEILVQHIQQIEDEPHRLIVQDRSEEGESPHSEEEIEDVREADKIPTTDADLHQDQTEETQNETGEILLPEVEVHGVRGDSEVTRVELHGGLTDAQGEMEVEVEVHQDHGGDEVDQLALNLEENWIGNEINEQEQTTSETTLHYEHETISNMEVRSGDSSEMNLEENRIGDRLNTAETIVHYEHETTSTVEVRSDGDSSQQAQRDPGYIVSEVENQINHREEQSTPGNYIPVGDKSEIDDEIEDDFGNRHKRRYKQPKADPAEISPIDWN